MHPLPRTIQQRIIRLIARFAAFVMSPKDVQIGYLYGGAEALDIEIARHVLSDLIVSNRTKTQEWGNMLLGLSKAMGDKWNTSSSGTSKEATEALITLKLPDTLKNKAREAANGVKEKLLPLLQLQHETSGMKRSSVLDVVTRAKLTTGSPVRRCLFCSGRSAIISSARLGDWEPARRQNCMCGGSWVAE